MKHFLLKFNHGVEIGAYLAYRGHFRRTNDFKIYQIMQDEVEHRATVLKILNEHGSTNSKAIDFAFNLVGNCIQFACQFCPLWSLDFVAKSMEWFAIVNYTRLSSMYPDYKYELLRMAVAEDRHKQYFGRMKRGA